MIYLIEKLTHYQIMHIQSAIEELKEHTKTDVLRLHSGASVERIYNKALPEDFKTLYRFSNGFETDEDIFNMIRIEEIIENKIKITIRYT